jgi:DNA replication and repair protein RecF
VFFGKNGAGKTNILEAISLFSSDRGLRKASIADFTNFNTKIDGWSLELASEKDGYKTFLETGLANGRRFGKIDGSPTSSLSALEEFIWLLWITPSMDTIFIGSRTDRRNFFDHLVSGCDGKYKARLKKIQSLQKERLSVLLYRRDETWLNILENRIAEESVLIAKTRFDFIEQLRKIFENCYSNFLRPNLSINGKVEKIVETNSDENAVLDIADILKSYRNEDCERQITNISVHKSSWLAYHPKNQLEAENCSTGEQKAFLISLVLAVARIYQKSKRGIPVLLLDDLMMHLDKNRRKTLIDELVELNIQTFFTGTEQYLFEEIKDIAQVFQVENSICSEIYSQKL